MRTRVTVIGVAILGLWLTGLTVGCSGDDSEHPSGAGTAWQDAVTPYTVRCVETACQQQSRTCEDAKQQRCDDCYAACARSSSPAGCAGTCRSVCSGNCSCSSANDTCTRQGVEFLPPPRNEDIYQAQLTYFAQCGPDVVDPELIADYVARSYRHEYLDELKCSIAKACGASSDCAVDPPKGTVGDELCARQRACGQRCDVYSDDDSVVAGLVNNAEPRLRPALVAELKRCAAEPSCEIATACWEALQPALFLTRYPNR